MTQAKLPKKSEVLEIRIPYPTKTAFMEKAHAEGRAASEIVREQIDAYLERAAEPQSFTDKAVVLIRRNLHGAGLMLAGAGSALAISLAASPATAVTPARTAGESGAPTIVVDVPAGGLTAMELGQLIGQAFARLDSDGNGILSSDEAAR